MAFLQFFSSAKKGFLLNQKLLIQTLEKKGNLIICNKIGGRCIHVAIHHSHPERRGEIGTFVVL